MPVNFCARSRSSAERARRRLRAGEEASGFARGTVEEEERVRGLDAGEVIAFVRLAGGGESAFEPVALGKSDASGAERVIVILAASRSSFSSKASRWSIYKILSVDFQSIF